MANNNIETDALEQAAQALNRYISEITDKIYMMRDAAIDCSDNMGGDVISQNNIDSLNDCLKKIQVSVDEAEELRNRILKRKDEIEEGF